mmetsp:Transcript_20793/g.57115  ORF Transcript_20793/g.57115 Transcript_20793/m.57115 type:complete len:248 (+) Transcript_20793:570-1313(+)
MALCRHMPKRSIRSSPLCFQVVRAADGSRRPLPPPMQQDYLSLSDADSWVDTARPRPEDESGLVYAPGGAARGPEKPKFQAFSGGGQILGGGSGQPAMEVLGHGSEAEQLAQAMALSSDLAHRERLLARLPVEPTDSGARVLIRLPNGTRSHRRFPTDASLQAVVRHCGPLLLDDCLISFVTFPHNTCICLSTRKMASSQPPRFALSHLPILMVRHGSPPFCCGDLLMKRRNHPRLGRPRRWLRRFV